MQLSLDLFAEPEPAGRPSLSDVPLARRVRAVAHLIRSDPGLSIPERLDLLAAALGIPEAGE